MADSVDQRRGGLSLSLPLLPGRLPLPNPFAWLPRPRLIRGRKRTIVAATTSVAMGDGVRALSVPTVAPSKVPLKPASDVFAGALARAASQSTIHPLDTLKVRLQTKAMLAPKIGGLSKIGQLVPPIPSGPVKFELANFGSAFASLYKGVLGAASGAGIAIGAYFAVYGVACNVISRNTELSPGGVAFAAGGIAALGSSFVKVPLAVCIRSVQAGVYPNVIDACKSIVAKAGPRGLFTGYLPTVLEDVPDMAIKFAAYESMRQIHQKVYKGRPATPQEDFAFGAVAGALAAASTTPLDVIKTNMMCAAASRPSMLVAAQQVYAQGGAPAFFRGIGARALSNGINSAVFFAFFEMIRSNIAKVKLEAALKQQQQQQMHVTALAVPLSKGN